MPVSDSTTTADAAIRCTVIRTRYMPPTATMGARVSVRQLSPYSAKGFRGRIVRWSHDVDAYGNHLLAARAWISAMRMQHTFPSRLIFGACTADGEYTFAIADAAVAAGAIGELQTP